MAEDEGWETVSSSKKKGKNVDSKRVDNVEFNLKSNEVLNPRDIVRPENLEYVGQYLVSRKRGMIKEANGSIRRVPPPRFFREQVVNVSIKPAEARLNALEPFGPFSIALIRNGLENPDTVLPKVDIIIGRGCLKKIMKCFENRHYDIHSRNPFDRHDFDFAIKRQDNFLMIEDTEKWGNEPAHGYAFEEYMTVCPNDKDIDCFFYRNICYDLSGMRLLVGFEVDCVLNNPSLNYPSVELKSHNVKYSPHMLDYWYTLALADTKYLCIGAIDKTHNLLVSMNKLQVHQILPPEHEALRNRFTQLSMVLHWIRNEFHQRNGQAGSLKFDCAHPHRITLSVTSQ